MRYKEWSRLSVLILRRRKQQSAPYGLWKLAFGGFVGDDSVHSSLLVSGRNDDRFGLFVSATQRPSSVVRHN
jgi:hypothetical protein